jgi:thiol-disulfide isomerase/thioredoxin
MKIKKVGVLCFLLFLTVRVTAQNFVPLKPKQVSPSAIRRTLRVGDTMPNVLMNRLVNYRSEQVRFNDIKKKLTILDFWSSSCSSCIDLFPHMLQLQNRFKDEIQIILVNGKSKKYGDDVSKISGILKKVKYRTKTEITLPVVYNSEILDNYFPYVTVPHEVWIDQQGKVVAITGAAEITEGNIEAFINGRKISLRQKNDVTINLANQNLSELYHGENPIKTPPLFSSTLVRGRIDGINSSGIRVAQTGDVYGMYIANQPLLALYRSAYRDIIKYPDNQLIFKNTDSLLFHKLDYSDTSSAAELYSYDLISAPGEINKLLKYMQSDLDKVFHISLANEKRILPCYVVTLAGSESVHSRGGEAIWDTKSKVKYIQNYPVNQILTELNKQCKIPLIDETGSQRNMDIELPANLEDGEELIKALMKSGLKVQKTFRDLDVIIFKDKQ